MFKTAAMSDSEDDVPLAQRAQAAAAPAAATANGVTKQPLKRKKSEDEEDSPSSSGDDASSEADEEESSSSEEEEDSDDDRPLSQRKPKKKTPAKAKPKKKENGSARKRQRTERESRIGAKKANGLGKVLWKTLRHAGVLFPPEYVPHGVKMKYEGKPVDLTPDQEEVATMFAVMKETDYMNKPVFLRNFWDGFKEVLGKNHIVKDLAKCDFTDIYDHLMAEREKKKNMTKEVGLWFVQAAFHARWVLETLQARASQAGCPLPTASSAGEGEDQEGEGGSRGQVQGGLCG
jgi:DNA topoisomerase-1